MSEQTAAPAASPSEHSAPGGPVHETGLRPKFGKLVRLRCGCSADDTRHITFCALQWESLNLHKERVSASRAHAARMREAVNDPLLG